MKVLTVKKLEIDKKDFEEMIEEQKQKLIETQDTILRLEGALVYATKNLEVMNKKEEKEDAPSS